MVAVGFESIIDLGFDPEEWHQASIDTLWGVLHEVAEFIAVRGSEYAPKDVTILGMAGTLSEMVGIEYSSTVSDLLAEVIWNVPYAQAHEFGRTPGARRPPAEALMGWVERHFPELVEESAVFHMAVHLSMLIGFRGWPAKWYALRASDDGEALMQQRLG